MTPKASPAALGGRGLPVARRLHARLRGSGSQRQTAAAGSPPAMLARARAHTQVRARPDESRSASGLGAQGLETVVLTGLAALSHRPSFSATPVPALEAHGVGPAAIPGVPGSERRGCPSLPLPIVSPAQRRPDPRSFSRSLCNCGRGRSRADQRGGSLEGPQCAGEPFFPAPTPPRFAPAPPSAKAQLGVTPALPTPLGGWGEPWPQELSQPRPPASASSRPLLQEAFSPERGLGMIPRCGLPLEAGMGVWIEF